MKRIVIEDQSFVCNDEKQFAAEKWSYIISLHEVCNAFFSVTLPLVHLNQPSHP